MFKPLIKILLGIIILIILLISYLSIFGIKTDKFNELIKSEIIKQDKRVNLILKNVFIKLNIIEKSLFLNSKNLSLQIDDQNQKIANVELHVGLETLLRKKNNIKRLIINSEENKITNLIKFIKAYKLTIPILYFENIVTSGKILYDINLGFTNNKLNEIEVIGKVTNSEVKIYKNKTIKNINLNFIYKKENLNLSFIDFNYKNLNFKSNNLSVNFKDKLISVEGDLKNKIDSNFITDLSGFDLNKYFDENFSINSNSKFKITLNNKFKLLNYNLKNKLDFDYLKINLKKNQLDKYLINFKDTFYLKNGNIEINLNNEEETYLNLKSQYSLNENKEPKDLIINYSKKKLIEKYEIKVDSTVNEIIIDQLSFHKKPYEELFLELNLIKKKNIYEIENLKIFNRKNKFYLKNIKLNDKFKVKDFISIKADYFNKNNFHNIVSIKKDKNIIKLNSNSFDVSSNIEKTLKSESQNKIFDIFDNLNSTLIVDIKLAKIDSKYNFNNLTGEALIKNNRVDTANIKAYFDSKNQFVYTKDQINEKTVTTIFSDLAEPFVKKFKFIKGFEEGKLDYTSTEISEDLSFSELRIYNFKLQNMPALTKLLSLASLQGIADLATGEGIRFNDFEMFFENSKNLITINEIYALGPAISILMEGYIEKNKLVSLRGTLVPATTINKTIAKIPLLGNILVGEKMGEGVFGVSFKIKGPPNNLDTRVNPIKTLAPRFITRTLEKIKKTN